MLTSKVMENNECQLKVTMEIEKCASQQEKHQEEPSSKLLFNLQIFSSISSMCNCLITCLTLAIFAFLVFLCRDYLKFILIWLEDQDPIIIYLIFIFLFALVSFPFTWGYLFLNLACGYLFGLFAGLLAVIITASLGVTLAHFIIKNYMAEFALSRLFHSENARALLQVIAGPQAFKVIFFARLTPIPFGLQNTIFAVSSVSHCVYITASMSGLLPTQIINVYLGSTLRSMEDVLSDTSTATTGYFVFAVQIVIGCLLMTFVIRKARSELRIALMQHKTQLNLQLDDQLLT